MEAAVLFQSQIPILNPGVAAQGWAGSASSWAISQWKAKDILAYVDLNVKKGYLNFAKVKNGN